MLNINIILFKKIMSKRLIGFFMFLFAFPIAKAENCIWLHDVFLGNETYLYLKNEISNKDAICLKDIPGGQANLFTKYSQLIKNKKIHVYGYCNSLCALLALSVDHLVLHRSKDAENPSYLFIHGTFNIKNEKWDPSSLDNIDYLHDRLKVIKKEHIARALSFKTYGPSGLIISSTPFSQLKPSKSLVQLCEDFPKKCISLEVFNLNKIEIIVK